MLVEQMDEIHRTHVRTRSMADDILRLTGEQIRMQATIQENTELTRQVRDILITFRVTALIAKWIATVGAAFAALYYAWLKIR